jgi:endonuclease/exonuclease/phosphatase family metal-dependent hydrolase
MFDAQSIRTRREQHRRLRARLDEWVRNNGDKDVIVVGDFNDFVGSPALDELTGARAAGGVGFVNAGARLPDDAITHLSPNGRIDHVLLSSPAVSQEEWTGQAFTYPKPRGAERKRYEQGVSDHLPTWATFTVSRDNDP